MFLSLQLQLSCHFLQKALPHPPAKLGGITSSSVPAAPDFPSPVALTPELSLSAFGLSLPLDYELREGRDCVCSPLYPPRLVQGLAHS